jgi:hypothetical protein
VAPPPGFSQVFILKVVKVLCFDTLLQVFILNELEGNITPTLFHAQGNESSGVLGGIKTKTSDEREVSGT